MRETISRLTNLRFPEWSMPLALLVALVLGFGLLLPSLGFYQDDWLFIYNHYALGPQGIWDFMYYDGTPFASILNNAQFALLGYSPLPWQVFSLLARWLTVVVFWLILRRLWPAHSREAFLSALLFAIHPLFTLQPMAVTFSQVWVAYFALGLSIYWMILCVQRPERFWFYTALSLLAGTFNLLSGEYFAGLEFARPVFLWFALAGQPLSPKERAWRSLRHWLPYLVVLGGYIYWRFFVYEVPIENRNQPVLIEALLRNPLEGVWLILVNLLPDTLLIVISSWYNVLTPDAFDLTVRINQFAFLLAAFSGLLAFYFLHRTTVSEELQTNPRVHWPLQALVLGGVLVVCGLIPPYVGGLFLNDKNPLWNSRFGMASMLGASMVVVAMLEWLVVSRRARVLLLAVLVGLALGWHLRYTNNFRWAWRKQVNFYRQLILRVPQLAPGTALVAEGEILPLMGDYPTAYAINTLYARPRGEEPGRARYWFYGMTTNFGRNYGDFGQGMILFTRHRSMVFKGDSLQSILFSFEPDQGQCLRIYRPQDALIASSVLGRYMLPSVSISRPELILPSDSPNAFLVGQLGITSFQDWCYFYQKADMARQNGDWQSIARYWRELQKAGLNSKEPFEYLSFIEAYLRLGDFEQARDVSLRAVNLARGARPMVCNLWKFVLQETPNNEGLKQALLQFQQEAECP